MKYYIFDLWEKDVLHRRIYERYQGSCENT